MVSGCELESYGGSNPSTPRQPLTPGCLNTIPTLSMPQIKKNISKAYFQRIFKKVSMRTITRAACVIGAIHGPILVKTSSLYKPQIGGNP